MEPQLVLEYLANNGLMIGMTFGVWEKGGIGWSLAVVKPDGEHFAGIHAESYEDAVALAYIESVAKGWVLPKESLNVYNPKGRKTVRMDAVS